MIYITYLDKALQAYDDKHMIAFLDKQFRGKLKKIQTLGWLAISGPTPEVSLISNLFNLLTVSI